MALLSLGGVCLLLSCLAAVSGDDVPVISIKTNESSEVLLSCFLDIREKKFDWKVNDTKEVFFYDPDDGGNVYGQGKGDQDPQFKGRVKLFDEGLKSGNASIVIQKALVKDTGNYECFYIHGNGKKTTKSRISLTVGACPKPYIHVDMSNLKCEIEGAFPEPTIEWQNSARKPIKDAVEIKSQQKEDGRFDKIWEINVTQSGIYYCVVTQEEICHQIEGKTAVHIPGACPKPVIHSHDTVSMTNLKCEVKGAFPEPTMEWQDSTRKPIKDAVETKSEWKEGRFDKIWEINVKQSGIYYCVVTQEGICHQTEQNTTVHIAGPSTDPGYNSSLVAAIVGLVLLFVATVVLGCWCHCKKMKAMKSNYLSAGGENLRITS
ncbi:CD276 antigen homolog isoform X2 [Nelusetta ayraudi]|uniref:CD276 antigen homolog isoform X2 n=1 Tax=Nelusetta ayraudi TaxID=303726 RepID=UPI003F6E53CB